MSRENPFLSCVVPAYNEAANIPHFIPALAKSLNELGVRYEIIVIDDGSKDNTLATLQPFLDQYPLKVFELSRNFGKEAAISAGLDQVSGNVTLLIDADFQHPISAVGTMLDLWRSGYDMVYGIRDRKTESGVKQFLTRKFYWLMNAASSIDIPADAGDFRLMDQRVVKALQDLPERTLYMKGMYAWVGFRSIGVHFTEAERHAGESNFNWKRLTGLALTGLTAFSDLPLRICVFLGAFIAFMALTYGAYITCDALIDGTTVPGWTTLAAGMMLLGGIQLLFIGVLGEYIARIYNETKGRPKYIIARQYDEQNPAQPHEMNMIELASQQSLNTSQATLRDD